jgi:phosphate starvation-inducible protein PhoH
LLCGGPAGSGKTYLSCGYAVNSFRAGVANKIIMTRPTITVENEYFLPGTMEMKMNPIRPLLDFESVL